MCTVTYLPTRAGFVLTHNRDEAPVRSPKAIARAGDLLFPRDTLAGGAWIAASAGGRAACLLNGAFERHERQPPYRRSRGLVLLDSFAYANAEDFAEQYDFAGVEPFTFLAFAPHNVLELRWDGVQKHPKTLPPDAPHFWCSATLYPAEWQARREQVFRDWLTKPPQPPTAESVLHLHLTGSVGDPAYDFVMNRGRRVQTVSITQLTRQPDRWRMEYRDLLEGVSDVQTMEFSELLPA